MNTLSAKISRLVRSIDSTKWKRITGLTVIFLLISIILPLSILYKFPIGELSIDAWKSNDMDFHFMRIEGLVNAIKEGNYPSLINMFGFSNAGQLVNGVYPWPTLIIFAIPRLFISNIPLSYLISFIIIHFIALSTFYSLIKYLYNKTSLAIFSAIVFSVFPIFLEETYERFDVGSVLSYIFAPLIILGLLYIFSSKNTGSMLKGSFILAFGLGLVANSHVISLLFAIIGIIFYLIFKIFTGQLNFKRFMYLVIGIIMSMITSIQSWGSIMVISLKQNFVRPYETIALSDHSGVNLLEGIISDFRNHISGGHSNYHIGIVLLLTGIVIPVIYFVRSYRNNRSILGLFAISIFLIFLSSSYFPWNLISDSPIKVIQFPSRFLIPAGILLTIVMAYVFNRFRTGALTLFSAIVLLVGVNSLQILNQNLQTANPKINTQLNDETYRNQLKFTSLPENSESETYQQMATSGRHVSNDYYPYRSNNYFPYDGETNSARYKKLTNQVRLSKTNPENVEREVALVSSNKNEVIYTNEKAEDVTIPFLKYNFMEYHFTSNGKTIQPVGLTKINSFIIPMERGENRLTISIQDPTWYKLFAIYTWVSIVTMTIFYLIIYVFRKKSFLGYNTANIDNGRPKRNITRL